MRLLIVLIIGIVVGALCGSMAARSIAMTHAYPRGVMAVLQVRLANARHAVEAVPACDPIRTASELAALASFLPEISPALNAQDEPRLLELSQQMQAASASVGGSDATASCAELARRIERIGRACEACHQEYR